LVYILPIYIEKSEDTKAVGYSETINRKTEYNTIAKRKGIIRHTQKKKRSTKHYKPKTKD